MTETPTTVYAWSVDTFGPVTDLYSTVSRAYQEYAELLDILGDKPASAGHTTTLDGAYTLGGDSAARRRMIAHEAADVAQILFRAAGGAGLTAQWDGSSFTNCKTSVVMASINRNMGDLLMEWAYRPTPVQQIRNDRLRLEDHLYYILSGLDYIAATEGDMTLFDAVQSKMAINRQRRFVGERHVEEAPQEKRSAKQAEKPALAEEGVRVQMGVVGRADYLVTLSGDIHALPSTVDQPYHLDLGDRVLTIKKKVKLPPGAVPDMQVPIKLPVMPRVDYAPKVIPLTAGEDRRSTSPWARRADEIAQL